MNRLREHLNQVNGYTAVLLLMYIGTAVFFLRHYFILDINLYLGILVLPYVLIVDKGHYSMRYLWPLLVCLVLLFLVPAKTVFFFTAFFGILALLELLVGKTSSAGFWLLFVISPTCKYLSSMFGMPVRLWLSDVTGWILNGMGKQAGVAGNMIILDGVEFSVDPACAGLGMMLISLVIGLFAVAHYQRVTRRKLSALLTVAFIGFTVLLNVLSNLMRIVVLVLFHIMPGNPFHDIVGVVCLTGYVVVVLLITCKFLFSRFGKPIDTTTGSTPPIRHRWYFLVLLPIWMYGGMRMPANYIKSVNTDNVRLDGYRKEKLETGVLKFTNAHALVYIKPVNFYTPEHNPLVCWTNSGYEFTYMNKESMGGTQICTGVLHKGSDTLYTAWWFDNGSHQTISQLDWRWKALKGEPDFHLINISAATKQELVLETLKLFKPIALITNK